MNGGRDWGFGIRDWGVKSACLRDRRLRKAPSNPQSPIPNPPSAAGRGADTPCATPCVRARCGPGSPAGSGKARRSEEHTSELQSLMRTSYAVFCLKKKTTKEHIHTIL